MSPMRPHGAGWVDHEHASIEVQADPPGDGIGPDHTAPDAVPGQDPREAKRLAKDHRALVKDSEGDRPSTAADEPNDTQHDPAQRAAFATPFDPREGKGDS